MLPDFQGLPSLVPQQASKSHFGSFSPIHCYKEPFYRTSGRSYSWGGS